MCYVISFRCAVTLNWDAQFMYHNSVNQSVRGNLGVSLLPGAARVWDRYEDRLRNCTLELCPWSVPIPSGALLTSNHRMLSRRRVLSPADTSDSQRLINRPGFSAFPLDRIYYDTTFSLPQQSGGGIMLVKGYRLQMDAFLQTRMASIAPASRAYASGVSPSGVLQNSSLLNLSYWTSNGYNVEDALEYLRAVLRASWMKNSAGDIVLPSSVAYR